MKLLTFTFTVFYLFMSLDAVSSLEHCAAHASSSIHKLGTSTMKLLHALEGASLDNVQLLLTAIYRDVKNVWRFTSLTQSFSWFAASLNTGNAVPLLVPYFQKIYVLQ